jgi:hypothetical protein
MKGTITVQMYTRTLSSELYIYICIRMSELQLVGDMC